MNSFSVLKNMYYSRYNTEELKSEIIKEIDPFVIDIKKEYQFIFDKMIKSNPCIYWNKTVFFQTRDVLEKIFVDSHKKIELSNDAIENFLMGYNSYLQITENILDLANFNLSSDIKTRLYRIPTYTSLVEGCLSNILRSILCIVGVAVGKDYSCQQKLRPILDIMKANGFTEIESRINVNIRNSINHGKVSLNKSPQDQISFYYFENHQTKVQTMDLYKFDNIINDTYDTVSAVLLAFIVFLNRHITINLQDYSDNNYIAFDLLANKISLPGTVCHSISEIQDKTQINIDIDVETIDLNYLVLLSIEIAVLVCEYYDDYKQYMISFKNPRLGICWAKYKNEELGLVLKDISNISVIYKSALDRQDFIYYKPVDNENIDINEIKYFCFPNYKSERISINHIEDVSTEVDKRLRAYVFIGDLTKKSDILSALDEAVSWLKNVKNPPSACFPHKNGNVEADSLYINVYRQDMRTGTELNPNNDNFVCFLDYNRSGKTQLLNGGLMESVWNKLYHEKVCLYDIAWRESKYIIRKVIKYGANDLCPCGSGKKFKKCCRGKGIYD